MALDKPLYWDTAAGAPSPELVSYVASNGGGSVGGFTHTQAAPSASWSIPHTLGRLPRSVTVVVDGSEVDADVAYPNLSTITVVFASPTVGRAEIL